MAVWWRDVIREATFQGYHTPIVQLGMRYGMALFIASEVMFFVAFFWAFFASSLFPVGGVWPPKGIHPFDPFEFPFLNTLILLLSGTTVTWAHHSLLEGDRSGMLRGLAVTVFLGLCFTSVQAYEYSHAAFPFTGGIFPSTFFMATGFHGFHVIIGTTFLIVCLVRAWLGQLQARTIISASRRPRGTGISSMSSGCSCSSASIGGAVLAPPRWRVQRAVDRECPRSFDAQSATASPVILQFRGCARRLPAAVRAVGAGVSSTAC